MKRAVRVRSQYALPQAEDCVVKTTNLFSVQERDMESGVQSGGNKTAVPLNDEETAVSSMPATANLIIVYARKNPKYAGHM